MFVPPVYREKYRLQAVYSGRTIGIKPMANLLHFTECPNISNVLNELNVINLNTHYYNSLVIYNISIIIDIYIIYTRMNTV